MAKAGFNLNVQGCRGLFASMVLVEHVQNSGLSSGVFWSNPVSQYYFMSFQYAVELFFCISGYVITMSLARAPTASKFLGDRLLRIMPVFLVIHLLLFTVGPIVRDKVFVDVTLLSWCSLFVTNVLLLPGIFPLPIVQPQAWSLSYEMLFYLLAAAYYFHGHRIARMPRIVLTTVLLVLLFNLYPRAIFFSVGVLARLSETRLSENPTFHRFNRLSPLVYVLIMLTCWRGIDYLSGVGPIDYMTMLDWVGDIRIVLAIVAYLAGLAFFVTMLHDDGIFGRLMRSRLFQYLGAISYSFYLWHPLIMYGTKRILRNFVLPYTGVEWGKALFFATSLPLSLVAAHVSYVLVEQMFTKKAKAYFSAPKIQTVPVVAAAEVPD